MYTKLDMPIFWPTHEVLLKWYTQICGDWSRHDPNYSVQLIHIHMKKWRGLKWFSNSSLNHKTMWNVCLKKRLIIQQMITATDSTCLLSKITHHANPHFMQQWERWPRTQWNYALFLPRKTGNFCWIKKWIFTVGSKFLFLLLMSWRPATTSFSSISDASPIPRIRFWGDLGWGGGNGKAYSANS